MEELTEKVEEIKLTNKVKDVKNLKVPSVCKWYSYKGTRCRLNTLEVGNYCKVHTTYLRDTFYKYNEKNEEECCVSRDIKIVPRSFQHVTNVMKKYEYDDPTVEVRVKGNDITEEANIESEDFIELNMDETRYYYNKVKGQKHVGDLRIFLKDFCGNNAEYVVGDEKYCEGCYKIKGVKLGWPHLSLLK